MQPPLPAAYRDAPTFTNVKIEGFNYLFFLVLPTRYKTDVFDELRVQFEPFGDDLGEQGMVIKAVDAAYRSTANEVINKSGWPAEIHARLENEYYPFMLVIKKDFGEFRPDLHPWSILWFSEYVGQEKVIHKILAHLAMITRKNEDIQEYLTKISKKRKFKGFFKYFEFKPGMFGLSIDLTKIFVDRLDSG